MRHILVALFCFLPFTLSASDSIPQFSVKIIDYSLSWTSSMHYAFNNEEMSIVRVDNVNKNDHDTLSHRQLLGREKELISRYLTILSQIQFNKEYRDITNSGERNQKRITLKINDQEQSVFISNVFQRDIAAFITFINSFIIEKNKMKEFVDPNKPKQVKTSATQYK